MTYLPPLGTPTVPIGTKTRWGKVSMIKRITEADLSERYYWMVDGNSVAMMPADVVEPSLLPLERPSEQTS